MKQANQKKQDSSTVQHKNQALQNRLLQISAHLLFHKRHSSEMELDFSKKTPLSTAKGTSSSHSSLANQSCTCGGECWRFERKGDGYHLSLTRSKALNALNLCMVTGISNVLQFLAPTDVVVFRGDTRSFCAGGDVKTVYLSMAGGDHQRVQRPSQAAVDFFESEYEMDFQISLKKFVQVSFIDGICMGGGVGVACHGQFQVATERTTLAMPENGIGFFCDVGASYLLSRLTWPKKRVSNSTRQTDKKEESNTVPQTKQQENKNPPEQQQKKYKQEKEQKCTEEPKSAKNQQHCSPLGLFLAMTGARVTGRDILAIGLATHFIDSTRLGALEEALLHTPANKVGETLDNLCETQLQQVDDYGSPLLAAKNDIESSFSQKTPTKILQALQAIPNPSTIVTQAITALQTQSPLSICVIFEMMRRARSLTCAECFAQDKVLYRRFMENSDFFEGVRSVLVDKDKSPKWMHPDLSAVPAELVDSFFQ